MFGLIKGGAIRTNLAVLAASATQTLVGVLFVVYGSQRVLGQAFISTTSYWTVFIIVLGLGGVLLLVAKSIVRPRWLRLALGIISVLPVLIVTAIAFIIRSADILTYSVLVALTTIYALLTDESELEETTRSLLVFFSAALLLLQPFAFIALKGGEPPAVPLPFMFAMATLGACALWMHATRPGAKLDLAARYAMAASFGALAVGAYLHDAPVVVLVYAPLALTLALHRFFKNYRLGLNDKPGSLPDEAVSMRPFGTLSEILAWGTFVFSYVHMLLEPGVISVKYFLFVLFIGAYIQFTLEYQLLSAKTLTFKRLHRSSMMNGVLLSIICHATGGLTSPYNWFFLFVLMSGSAAPKPSAIRGRILVIFSYLAFETVYFLVNGFMTREIVLNHLLLLVFIFSLSGMYLYQIAVRRLKSETDLAAANKQVADSLVVEIATRKLVEKQAADIDMAKKRDEAMLSSLADGVIGLDMSGLINLMNPAAEGLLGFSRGSVLGKRLRDIVRIRQEGEPSFTFGNYLDTAARGNAIPFPENTYLEKEADRRMYLTGVVLPITNESNQVSGIVVTISDITYTREVDQMKTSFLSVAAHQLRTPLSTIRWFLELVNDPSEGKLKKNQKMFVENAYVSLIKMVGLVNRLLAVTRLEAGRVPFKPEPTDIKTMTKEILESLKGKLADRRLEVRADLSDQPSVPLDHALAREVFVNLIENAIRYTPEGGRISIETHDEGDKLSWSVTDTGIGIPKAQHGKIFEKFFRAGNAAEYSSEGSGLGLYLARFIVDAWGGQISFESEEGKGAKFRVTIPKTGMKSKEGFVSLNA